MIVFVMRKNKYHLIPIFLLSIIFFFIEESKANEFKKFLTLKNNKVNLRQGPSFDYPIKLVYQKKYLPVIILDRSETWRKIKDFENNSGWIHISQLSKKKSGINIKNNSILYKKNTIYSKPIVKIESGRLVLIDKCKINWCKVSSGDYDGWIFKNSLWGRTK
jgi:SH3-like domain-containing protein